MVIRAQGSLKLRWKRQLIESWITRWKGRKKYEELERNFEIKDRKEIESWRKQEGKKEGKKERKEKERKKGTKKERKRNKKRKN